MVHEASTLERSSGTRPSSHEPSILEKSLMLALRCWVLIYICILVYNISSHNPQADWRLSGPDVPFTVQMLVNLVNRAGAKFEYQQSANSTLKADRLMFKFGWFVNGLPICKGGQLALKLALLEYRSGYRLNYSRKL